MKITVRNIILLTFCFFLFSGVYAQRKKDRIKLERADVIKGGTFGGKRINKFIGNVAFSQQGTMLYCDSAYQYSKKPDQNKIEAFGNVKIIQGDSVTLTGDRLTYSGDTRKAVLTGRVFMRDKGVTLNTRYLEYDMVNKEAHYVNGGTIKDGETTLVSEQGFYSSGSKIFRFRKNVKVTNPVKNYTLTSDTLHYDSRTKIATFKGPSTIVSKDGVVNATEGEYNTASEETILRGPGGRAQVQTGSFILSGDQIKYDEKRKVGVARKNVTLYSEKDKVIIEGDFANYWGNIGITKVYGNALMKSVVNGDTLYLTADTLTSIENEQDPGKKRMLAYHHTQIFKSDLQGLCDSLVYNYGDSTIYFYEKPILWNGQNQITADSINVQLAHSKIQRMNLNVNSFIISQDTLLNFNQIKGKKMTAHFKDEGIYRVDVDGNGESIYFALEDDSITTGMNKVLCSNMVIRLEDNKVKTISFLTKPDGKFTPPHEIQEPETRLKGFVWKGKERPKLSDLLGKRAIN